MNWKALFADSSFFVKFILTVFFVIVGLLFSVVVTSVIFSWFGIPATGDISFLLDNHIAALKISQFLQSICGFLLPAMIMAYLTSAQPLSFLSLQKTPGLKLTLITIVFMLIAIPVINCLAELNASVKFSESLQWLEAWIKKHEDSRVLITEKFLETSTIYGLLLNIFLIAVIPAISEEFFFRGLLQCYFAQWTKNKHIAIWLTAFIFSAIHIQFYGFVPRILLGAYFGYLLVWSGSIWLPVIAHFVHNATAIVLYFLWKNEYIGFNPEEFGIHGTFFVACINAVLLVLMIYLTPKSPKGDFSEVSS